MSNIIIEPKNMNEAMQFSEMLAASNMVPASFKGKAGDVLVAIQWGLEIGLKPLQALQNLAVINGKPSIYGDAAIALVKSDERCLGVTEELEGEADNRVARCTVKRRYGNEVEVTVSEFSVADAKAAKLWNKAGPWTQYPKRMLAMKARGFALRDSFPDVLKGVITKEEAADYPTEPINVTPEKKEIIQPLVEKTLDEKIKSLKACNTMSELEGVWSTFDAKTKISLNNVKDDEKLRIVESDLVCLKSN